MTDERIDVVGLREVQRALRQLSDNGEWTKELRVTNKYAAESVAERARQLAPVSSGKLRRSIRAKATQKSASVAGGGARVPYFGWIDFGGTLRFRNSSRRLTRPYLKKGRILYAALAERNHAVVARYDRSVTDLLRRAGFSVDR